MQSVVVARNEEEQIEDREWVVLLLFFNFKLHISNDGTLAGETSVYLYRGADKSLARPD